MQHFGTRLQQALDRQGMSIRELHRSLESTKVPGRSYPQIHRYLKGDPEPPLKFTRAVAAILGVRASWLALGDGEMTEASMRRSELLRRTAVQDPLSIVLDHTPTNYTHSAMVRGAYLEALRRLIAARPDHDELTDERIIELSSGLWHAVSNFQRTVHLMAGRKVSRVDHSMYAVTAFQAAMMAIGRPLQPSKGVKKVDDG